MTFVDFSRVRQQFQQVTNADLFAEDFDAAEAFAILEHSGEYSQRRTLHGLLKKAI